MKLHFYSKPNAQRPLSISLYLSISLVFCFGFSLKQTAANQDTSPPISNDLDNGSFEVVDALGNPTNWSVANSLKTGGANVSVDQQSAFHGSQSLLIDTTDATAKSAMAGTINRVLDGTQYQGKRVRFRAAVRTTELDTNGRAQLWLRVDRKSSEPESSQRPIGAFDNMQNRPIRAPEWKHYEIVAQIDEDAEKILIGLIVFGKSKIWIDDASFEIIDDSVAVTTKPIAQGRGSQRDTTQPDPPQAFFVPWLLLVPAVLILFGLSQKIEPVEPGLGAEPSKLNLLYKFAFRFSCAYWIFYSFPAPFTSLTRYVYYVTQYYTSGVDATVGWTAINLFGIENELPRSGGSGDTTYDFIKLFVLLVVSVSIALIWSLIDRRKTDYRCANDLLRSYIRYVLAFTMLGYGLAKLGMASNQFSPPGINQLVKTYGESSPMNLLWTFMGASRAYTFFAGLGEVIGALLLIWRRTTTLGAMVVFGVMLNVVMLNFCYDVPVKLYSSHLCLMAIFLLLPDVGRLANLLVWNRPTESVEFRPCYTGAKTIWVQRTLKAVLIIVGIAMPLYQKIRLEANFTPEASGQPAYYGDYRVDEFTIDGKPAAQEAVNQNWSSVVMQRYVMNDVKYDFISIRTVGKTRLGGAATLSDDQNQITFNAGGTAPTEFTVTSIDDETIQFTGKQNERDVVARLVRISREDYLLVNRGFHWINETPYNR